MEHVDSGDSALKFLTQLGIDPEDVQDVQGRFSYAKAKATAAGLGYSFPNYGS